MLNPNLPGLLLKSLLQPLLERLSVLDARALSRNSATIHLNTNQQSDLLASQAGAKGSRTAQMFEATGGWD